jgi:hypothetical protein
LSSLIDVVLLLAIAAAAGEIVRNTSSKTSGCGFDLTPELIK